MFWSAEAPASPGPGASMPASRRHPPVSIHPGDGGVFPLVLPASSWWATYPSSAWRQSRMQQGRRRVLGSLLLYRTARSSAQAIRSPLLSPFVLLSVDARDPSVSLAVSRLGFLATTAVQACRAGLPQRAVTSGALQELEPRGLFGSSGLPVAAARPSVDFGLAPLCWRSCMLRVHA
jgi:hypothetical protein